MQNVAVGLLRWDIDEQFKEECNNPRLLPADSTTALTDAQSRAQSTIYGCGVSEKSLERKARYR